MSQTSRLRTAEDILVLGNCQTGGLTACLSLLLPDRRVSGLTWSIKTDTLEAIFRAAADADQIITSAPPELRARLIGLGIEAARILAIPSLNFSGFHPDLSYAFADGAPLVAGFAGGYQSVIGFWCWKKGFGSETAQRLFSPQAMRVLGYDRFWPQAVKQTQERFAATDIAFADVFLPLQSSGQRFMHSLNHPRISALGQLARVVARRLGATEAALALDLEALIPDALSQQAVWPVYPGVGEALGLSLSLIWKLGQTYYDLPRYLELQFTALEAADGELICPRAEAPAFDAAIRSLVA